jgi:hypothetical protein
MNWRHDLNNPNWQSVVNIGEFNMRDDMSHMEAVFLPIDRDRPTLPYDEFITGGGRHPSLFADDPKYGGHFYAMYEFPNGKVVSVICGAMFYSRIDAPYEVMFDDENDPHGYQTDEDLMILLAKAIGDIK